MANAAKQQIDGPRGPPSPSVAKGAQASLTAARSPRNAIKPSGAVAFREYAERRHGSEVITPVSVIRRRRWRRSGPPNEDYSADGARTFRDGIGFRSTSTKPAMTIRTDQKKTQTRKKQKDRYVRRAQEHGEATPNVWGRSRMIRNAVGGAERRVYGLSGGPTRCDSRTQSERVRANREVSKRARAGPSAPRRSTHHQREPVHAAAGGIHRLRTEVKLRIEVGAAKEASMRGHWGIKEPAKGELKPSLTATLPRREKCHTRPRDSHRDRRARALFGSVRAQLAPHPGRDDATAGHATVSGRSARSGPRPRPEHRSTSRKNTITTHSSRRMMSRGR